MNDVFDPLSLLYTVPILLVSYWLCRKALYGFLDPMVLSLFSLSAALGLVMFYYFNVHLYGDWWIAGIFCVMHLVLLGAFRAGYCVRLGTPSGRREPKTGKLLIIAYLSFGLFLGYFVYAHVSSGIGFFEMDTDLQKQKIFSEGGGLLRRVMFPWSAFCFFNFFYLYIHRYISRWRFFVFASALAVITWASGGKASLVNLFVVLFYAHVYTCARRLGARRIPMRWAVVVVFSLVMIESLYMFGRSDRDVNKYIDNRIDISTSWNGFVSRVVASGDFSLYYVGTGLYKSAPLGWMEFAKSVNGCLVGPFRLAEYERPIGADIVEKALQAPNEKNTGPNALAPFVAIIYFGPLAGCVFLVAMGAAVGMVKKWTFVAMGSDYYGASIFVLINSVAYLLFVDYTLCLMYVHAVVVLIAVLWILRSFDRPEVRPAQLLSHSASAFRND